MTVKRRKRKLSREEREALYKVQSNAGVDWDYPIYRACKYRWKYQHVDPVKYENGSDNTGG